MATTTLAALLKEAGAKLENFDLGAAADLYRQAMALQPGNAAAAMGLAMVFNRTEKPAEALKLLAQIWQSLAKTKSKTADTSKAAVLAQIGLAQQQLGQLAEALQSFRQAHSLKPTPELAERVKLLQQAVERPEPLEQLVLQALQAQRSGKLDEAIRLFRAALQLNADHPEALHGLGMALRAAKDFAGALPILQQAIILAPDRHDFFNDLGMLFQDQGDLQKAISFHNRALKLKPDFAAAFINLGVAYKRLSKFDEAIAAYRKAIELQPHMPEAHNNLGNLLRVTGDLSGAREELSKALALRPDYRDAAENLAAVEQLLPPPAPPAASATKATKTPKAKAAKPATPKTTTPKTTAAKAPSRTRATKKTDQ